MNSTLSSLEALEQVLKSGNPMRKEIILKEKTCGEVLLAQINNIIDVS